MGKLVRQTCLYICACQHPEGSDHTVFSEYICGLQSDRAGIFSRFTWNRAAFVSPVIGIFSSNWTLADSTVLASESAWVHAAIIIISLCGLSWQRNRAVSEHPLRCLAELHFCCSSWFELGRTQGANMLNQGAVMVFTGICGALVVMAMAYYVYW